MPGPIARWRDEVGSTYVIGRVRLALGVLLFWNAWRAARELEVGYFGDVFHWSVLPEWLVPSRGLYATLVLAQLVLAVLVVTGRRWARQALLLGAVAGGYVLLCDRVQFHHNRWALFCYAALLSLSPCEDARSPGEGVGPLWAARLAQLQLSIVYIASGGSKLADPDWRSGLVLLERARLQTGATLAQGIPARVVEWFSRPEIAGGLAKAAIATELGLAVGLWLPRTRVFALWWGACFHLTIEASSQVEGFTWLTLAVYALFATPDFRARTILYDPGRRGGRLAGRAVPWLDWLARFEVRPRGGHDPREGHAVVVVQRDGTLATGVSALAAMARGLPLVFILWGPLALLATGRGRR